eukprot:7009427-Pyramimonas_sp.AAC.1
MRVVAREHPATIPEETNQGPPKHPPRERKRGARLALTANLAMATGKLNLKHRASNRSRSINS